MNREPIFKAIFAQSWCSLPEVFHRHYAIRPRSNDSRSVEGSLDVFSSTYIKMLAPLLWLLGSAPPLNEDNVPVNVEFFSDENSDALHFHRVFNFSGRRPYHFRSRMIKIRNNELLEVMRFGVSWRMLYLWENNRIILKHRGYALHLAGLTIPLPVSFIFGDVNAEEAAISTDEFSMRVSITHPLFGKLYEYKGQFKLCTTT